MKKNFIFLILIICLLSLCACGAGKEPSPSMSVEITTSTTIPIETKAVETTEPPYTEIQISMDNWDDFFRVEYREIWNKNAFDEVVGMTPCLILVLKEEYQERLIKADTSFVDIKYSFNNVFYQGNVDYSLLQYTKGEKDSSIPGNGPKDGVITIYAECFGSDDYARVAQGSVREHYNAISFPEDFEVINIKGSIFLLE